MAEGYRVTPLSAWKGAALHRSTPHTSPRSSRAIKAWVRTLKKTWESSTQVIRFCYLLVKTYNIIISSVSHRKLIPHWGQEKWKHTSVTKSCSLRKKEQNPIPYPTPPYYRIPLKFQRWCSRPTSTTKNTKWYLRSLGQYTRTSPRFKIQTSFFSRGERKGEKDLCCDRTTDTNIKRTCWLQFVCYGNTTRPTQKHFKICIILVREVTEN